MTRSFELLVTWDFARPDTLRCQNLVCEWQSAAGLLLTTELARSTQNRGFMVKRTHRSDPLWKLAWKFWC